MTKIFSATLLGVTPLPVEVEADLSNGLPFFEIVGLPDTFLRESKTRIKSAIGQSGFDFPHDCRLVLNLAPSRLRKEGGGFEIALALKILHTSKQIHLPPSPKIMGFAELGLDGSLRGDEKIEALSFAALQESEIEYIIAPLALARKIKTHQPDKKVIGLTNLSECRTDRWWEAHEISAQPTINQRRDEILAEMSGITVSQFWVPLIEVAVVGNHNIFLCGPPGTGKTFFSELTYKLASCLRPSFTPPIEQRVLDCLFSRQLGQLPFASPHHSSSQAGLVGGGNPPQPGAITQAHGGILFLDELLEFSPKALDALREPLERGGITVQRSGCAVDFPCRFQLIAATNPCRCGYWRHPTRPCHCTAKERASYFNRVSGPLLDRFPVRVFVDQPTQVGPMISVKDLAQKINGHFEFMKGKLFELPIESKQLERFSFRSKINLTAVAKTLAILDRSEQVTERHLSDAIEFQNLEAVLSQPLWQQPLKRPSALYPHRVRS